MSDSEEETFSFYGKPLEQYDKDAFPKRKPISAEDQIATDTNGRRRFHGAFTGGFSAGFFNTVGSVQGWTPSEFKSSRSEKAENKVQKPEDYMDDEDVGEFGIAPQNIRATKDFNTSKKRRKQVFSDGPIPGEPVLHMLIESSTETIGYLLLKNIGLSHENIDQATSQKVYGCAMPKQYEVRKSIRNETYKIPDIYMKFLRETKTNTFGLGFSGLDKTHINLFSTSNFSMKDQNNKKVTIGGQAFGIGAFDEDIYLKEDISKYDFELTSETKKSIKKQPNNLIFNLFVPSKTNFGLVEKFPPPTIPHSFTGKHKIKKSRFEPIIEIDSSALPRHKVDANERAKSLGENYLHKPITKSNFQSKEPEKEKPAHENKVEEKLFVKSETQESKLFLGGLVFDKFVSAGKTEEHLDILEPVMKFESSHGTAEMRDAVKMKMFGQLTRVSETWIPCSLICKRFNIPEPGEWELETKQCRRKKNLIFQNETCSDETVRIESAGLQSSANLKANVETENVSELIDNPIIVESLTAQNIEPAASEGIVNEEKPSVCHIVDITEKLDISKKLDLFKAIFLDSDKEESDTEDINEQKEKEEQHNQRKKEMEEHILSPDMILPKIKPMKEGILTNVPLIKFSAPKKDVPVKEVAEDVNLYGPKLPENVEIVSRTTPSVYLESKSKNVDNNDLWIEKDELKKNDKIHKEKKKHKKDKHKKKHKHKR